MRLYPMTDAQVREASTWAIQCNVAACRVDRADDKGLYDAVIFGTDPSGAPRWGHLELPVPVIHPWWRPMLLAMLELDDESLDDVVGHQAGWLEDAWGEWEPGDFMPRDEDDDPDDILDDDDEIPIATGLRGLARHLEGLEPSTPHQQVLQAWTITARDLVFEALPVLPVRLRGSIDDATEALIDHLYRAVGLAGAKLSRIMEIDAPRSVGVYCEKELQQAVDRLFDNRVAVDRITTLAGDPLPDLGMILDENLEPPALAQVLAACRVCAS